MASNSANNSEIVRQINAFLRTLAPEDQLSLAKVLNEYFTCSNDCDDSDHDGIRFVKL